MRAVGCANLLLAALIALASGCCSVDTADYRAARSFYDSVAPEYRAYVEADPGLSREEKDRRHRLLTAREYRLDRRAALLEAE